MRSGECGVIPHAEFRTPRILKMAQTIVLSSAIGEVMAPQMLVTALMVSPDGRLKIDAGALHGRSELESGYEFVRDRAALGQPQSCWIIWIAIELDAANQPVRYKGLTASELLVNPQTRQAYKSVAGQVNRMSEAMRGGVNLGSVTPALKSRVKEQLMALGREVWDASPDLLRSGLETP